MRRHCSFVFVLAPLTLVGCGAGNGDKSNGTGNVPLDSGAVVADTSVDDSGGFDVVTPGLDASTDGNPFDPDAACAAKSFGTKKIPLALALVVDESGSMSEGSPSKMEVAKSGLKKALGDPRFDDVAVGLFKFGYTSGTFGDGCTYDTAPSAAPVPLAFGRTDLFAVIDALTPSASTPTYDALNAAYTWLAPRVKAKTPPENGKTAVILVTDGAPTCGKYTVDDYLALVAKYHGLTLDTFFVGLPGTGDHFDSADPTSPTAAAFMSKMAARGTDVANLPAGCDTDPVPMSGIPAKPCYFDFHSSFTVDAFADALQKIRKTIASCDYVMPTGTGDYDPAHPGVFVTDAKGTRKAIPQCTDPKTPGPDGCWDWTDASHATVTIYGAACDTVKTDDAAKVDILLPCKVK